MTGFGRASATAAGWVVEVELTGVNRKQIEVVVSLPPALGGLEGAIRRRVAEEISRGRVAARISASPVEAPGRRVDFDEELARRCLEAAAAISRLPGVSPEPPAPADLLRIPGILSVEESPADSAVLGEALHEALGEALAQLAAMQREEGEHLRGDLAGRLAAAEADVAAIAELAPGVPASHREQLLKRLGEAGLDLDLGDERLLREIALFADRCDISEECIRLQSHFTQFRTYLGGDRPAGRPLDFLCQELHRELNTIGSKANDAAIVQRVVEAKTELEKIREQVQNVQ